MNNYLRHFPEFESSDMPTFAGFEDTSWYNDSCPSFERKLKHGVAIRVWVEHQDPEQRDYLEKRFAIDMMQGCECVETVLITDDLEEVQAEIKKLIEAGERLTGPIAEEYR
jgi:hypothetical protein